MLQFILRRSLLIIPTFFVISLAVFLVVQLPPGSYADSYLAGLASSGTNIDKQTLENVQNLYGVSDPIFIQYGKWIWGIFSRGDFGLCFQYMRPVASIIWQPILLTMLLTLFSILFSWCISFPVGIFSAIKQYSTSDYIFTFLAFIGISVPTFLIALIAIYIGFKYFHVTPNGLFSPNMVSAPWSLAKVIDLAKNSWLAVVILGISGTGALIRTLRANLLDELRKPYVITARAKGLPEWKVLIKYPLRLALNPFVSGIGFLLPQLVSGSMIISVVLNLQLVGVLLLNSLQTQDTYLAASLIMVSSVMTVIGVLLSDILLGWIDPRIRYQQ